MGEVIGKPSAEQIDHLWAFIRGDLDPAQFEAWFFENGSLEPSLGEDLYLQLLGANYHDKEVLWVLRRDLNNCLKPLESCDCKRTRDLDAIPMGGEGRDKRFFATVQPRIDHGGDQWWLYLSQCDVCGQHWLIAQEERINDEYFVSRMTPAAARAVLEDKSWPSRFQTYEDVLAIGREHSKPCRFADDLAMSLVWSVEDLKRERPDISRHRIAELLGISVARVERLEKIIDQ